MLSKRILGILISMVGLLIPGQISAAQEMPADYQEVLKIVGKSGDFKSNVLKVNVPRNDLRMKIASHPSPTAFGFGGWFAMTKGDGGQDVMMGDLVLTQEEVNPVISALLDHGLEVTALHNHFFWDNPRVFYMHVHGHGKAVDLANQIKPALDLIGRGVSGSGPVTSGATPRSALDTATIARTVGHQGVQDGAVYKITAGRDDISVKEMGATINSRMGINSWAAFYGTDANAVIAGDIAMLENEVTPTLKALRAHGLDVVAIHQHMIQSEPMIIFLHYWGQGSADKLAEGFKAALAQRSSESM